MALIVAIIEKNLKIKAKLNEGFGHSLLSPQNSQNYE